LEKNRNKSFATACTKEIVYERVRDEVVDGKNYLFLTQNRPKVDEKWRIIAATVYIHYINECKPEPVFLGETKLAFRPVATKMHAHRLRRLINRSAVGLVEINSLLRAL